MDISVEEEEISTTAAAIKQRLRRVLHRQRPLEPAEEARLQRELRGWIAGRLSNCSTSLEEDLTRSEACCHHPSPTVTLECRRALAHDDLEAECMGLRLRVAEKELLAAAAVGVAARCQAGYTT